MFKRAVVIALGLMASAPAIAEQLKPEEARRFIAGKLFSFNCFDGTRGSGRMFMPTARSPARCKSAAAVRCATYACRPDTVQVKTESVCASMHGLPMQPCFTLTKLNSTSFRGSINGLGFAYCDFNGKSGRVDLATTTRSRSSRVKEAAAAPRATRRITLCRSAA